MAEETTNPQDGADQTQTDQSVADGQVDQKQTDGSADDQDSTLLGKDQQSDEGDADKDDAGDKSEIPESYEFTLPEGQELDQGMVEAMTPVFKEVGLSQEQAQKLVDAYAPQVQRMVEAQHESAIKSFKETVDGWKTDTQKELGAEAKAKLALCSKAIDQFGTPKLREVLNETGVGNHVELVNFMVKVGQLIAEDKFVDTTTRPPKESALYPSARKN